MVHATFELPKPIPLAAYPRVLFVSYAESFGAKGYRVESAAALLPTRRAALADNTVSVIACPVDYSDNLRLTEALGQLDDHIG